MEVWFQEPKPGGNLARRPRSRLVDPVLDFCRAHPLVFPKSDVSIEALRSRFSVVVFMLCASLLGSGCFAAIVL